MDQTGEAENSDGSEEGRCGGSWAGVQDRSEVGGKQPGTTSRPRVTKAQDDP